MTLDESVHGMRLRVIERAQVLGNVSAVCRELGISRTLFYRWRRRLERYGVDEVHPRRQRGRAGVRWRRRRSGAAGPGDRHQHRHPGLSPDRGLSRADLAGPRGPQYRAAAGASGRPGDAASAAHRARATGGTHGRAADRSHAPNALACPARPHPPRRGQLTGPAAVSGHLSTSATQSGRQGLADYGLRCRDLVWARPRSRHGGNSQDTMRALPPAPTGARMNLLHLPRADPRRSSF
jgi:hypothetical protein